MKMDERAIVGRKGEDLALEFLKKRNMKLVARNWRCGHKELDLVMYDGMFVRIVEVRTLCYPNLYRPAESVDWRKRAKVIGAARLFANQYQICNEIVFDIVSVVLDGESCSIEYIAEAFSPQW